MFRSLEHRNARLFFLGLSFSNIGSWIQMTAVSLLVYRQTGKATDVGITLFCQFLPMLVLGVWAGAISDRVDKRKMTMVTQSGQAVLAVMLGVFALSGLASLPVIYLVSLANGVVQAIDNPARRGFVIELVEPRHISNVVSLNTAVMTGSRIFGPALAALLLRWVEPGWLFIINGALVRGDPVADLADRQDSAVPVGPCVAWRTAGARGAAVRPAQPPTC